LGNTITGIMQAVTSMFRGGKDSVVRDKLEKQDKRSILPSYPWDKPIEERIKWMLDQRYWQLQYEKLQLHRKWFRNHLFYTGYHDSVLSDIGFSFDSIGINSAEYAFASNYYRSYIRYGAALYVQTAPEFIAQPTSPDAESQGVAEAARAALEISKENIGYDAIRAREATNLRLFGNSFRYAYYSVDPRYGFVTTPVYEDVEVQISEGSWQCPQCGLQGEGQQKVCPACGPDAEQPLINTPPQTAQVPQMKGKVAYPKGQEMCEVVWPFEIYVRSSVKTLREAPELLRVRMVDSVALRANFPKAKFGASMPAGEGMNISEDIGLVYQEAIPDLPSDSTQYPGWYERAVSQQKKTLIQGWIRPNQYFFDEEMRKKFPTGLYAGKAEDCLLESRDESMDDHWTHFKYIHVEGRFWGDGDDDLIPLQMQFDECDRMLMRHVDYNTMPILLADTQKVDKNNIIRDGGYMIEVKNLGQRNIDQAVKWHSGGEISPDVWNWKNSRLQDMQFHSGVSPAAIGQHETGINTFGGQQTAASQAQGMLAPLQLMYKEENELWAMQMTKLDCQNWLDDRVQATMGNNGQWEFKMLRGEMLKMDGIRWVARIIPLDPSKQQNLVQAISAGAFNPQLPQAVQNKVLELYQLSPDLSPNARDSKVQTKEIQAGKAAPTIQVPPSPENPQGGTMTQWPEPMLGRDNDPVHIQTLTDWMKSDDWDTQPPEVQAGAQDHLHKHFINMQKMGQVMGAIQAGAQEAGGQPPQQGKPQQTSPEQRQHAGQQKGNAMKPHQPQPSGGNGAHVGPRGQSHSAQQRRRNGRHG
jgi:hypothetical protein